ncbi:hypothetical protein [Paraburkholderia sp.]|uniref:hypothetical protein n=1 Tax=Paraburkholderia sp. TaxID=1926495 RepID=UPI002395F40E|nr:hypothetical protein [Paraburkholderia sp.]MDE1182411.1 hypothetical protein [Paraburkholderia sp.]
MKSCLLPLSPLVVALLAGCGGSGSDSSSAVSTAAAQTPTGTTLSNAASSSGTMTCGTPVKATTASGSAVISADTPSSDGTRMFASGSNFPLVFVTHASAADTLNWSVSDQVGKVVASGSTTVASGAQTSTLTCTSTLSGYFSATATLAKNGAKLASAGTRPAGIATFGILPNLASVVPAVTYSHQDQHRFGMQGETDNGPLLADLGISWQLDNRSLATMEPNGANTFSATADNLDAFFKKGTVMRFIRLDGIPAWASSTGAFQDNALPPTNLSYYQSYMNRVGQESSSIRATYFPKQSANYYQVTWEPDAVWKGTDAAFVSFYKTVYQGLHATDSQAVVMGPTDTAPEATTARLKRIASLGFGQYIDGVTTHGYYDLGTSPSLPPERLETDASTEVHSLMGQLRALRSEMASDYRSGLKLFNTEVGISYDRGAAYGANYPSANTLFAQGALVARTHIITLGEGVDQTWVFFGADYPNEVGYGTFFDLDHPQGQFGASNISPKPAAMAVAAMTRMLDGTNTLGRVNGTPSGVYAYAFRQLNNGAVVTALWTHNNAVWSASGGYSSTYSVSYSLAVDAPGTSGTVKVVDMMGNATTMSYSNGTLALALTEAPVYVVSTNASIASGHVTQPVGYQPG